jgi:hypothetical protein
LPAVSANWIATFGDVPPLGYALRVALAHRWLRIHSLPDAKRYATNELEYQALLARHNEVASEVLGESSSCQLFLRFRDGASADTLKRQYGTLSLTEDPELRYADPEDPETSFGFLQSQVEWYPGAYDQLLRDVADEHTPSAVFFSTSSGFVYSPYDGGIDIIAPRRSDLVRLRAKWKSWIPTHPEGL